MDEQAGIGKQNNLANIDLQLTIKLGEEPRCLMSSRSRACFTILPSTLFFFNNLSLLVDS
jgi:hypothetical protein